MIIQNFIKLKKLHHNKIIHGDINPGNILKVEGEGKDKYMLIDFDYAFKNGMHKIAVIANNFLNRAYSLRPLKIESPRTIMLQYTFKLDKDTKKKDEKS